MRLQHVLRARRRRKRACALLRAARRRHGAGAAREDERALVGALILEPTMIRVVAQRCPPAWFTSAPALPVMRALFCLSSQPELVDLDAVVAALEAHGALEAAGGRPAVLALVEPRARLDSARAEVAAIRAQLPPVEDESIVRLARVMLGGELHAPDPSPP